MIALILSFFLCIPCQAMEINSPQTNASAGNNIPIILTPCTSQQTSFLTPEKISTDSTLIYLHKLLSTASTIEDSDTRDNLVIPRLIALIMHSKYLIHNLLFGKDDNTLKKSQQWVHLCELSPQDQVKWEKQFRKTPFAELSNINKLPAYFLCDLNSKTQIFDSEEILEIVYTYLPEVIMWGTPLPQDFESSQIANLSTLDSKARSKLTWYLVQKTVKNRLILLAHQNLDRHLLQKKAKTLLNNDAQPQNNIPIDLLRSVLCVTMAEQLFFLKQTHMEYNELSEEIIHHLRIKDPQTFWIDSQSPSEIRPSLVPYGRYQVVDKKVSEVRDLFNELSYINTKRLLTDFKLLSAFKDISEFAKQIPSFPKLPMSEKPKNKATLKEEVEALMKKLDLTEESLPSSQPTQKKKIKKKKKKKRSTLVSAPTDTSTPTETNDTPQPTEVLGTISTQTESKDSATPNAEPTSQTSSNSEQNSPETTLPLPQEDTYVPGPSQPKSKLNPKAEVYAPTSKSSKVVPKPVLYTPIPFRPVVPVFMMPMPFPPYFQMMPGNYPHVPQVQNPPSALETTTMPTEITKNTQFQGDKFY